MSADWTTCRVVRDRAGHAVAVTGVIAMHLTGPRAGLQVHAARLHEFGPLVPVLDVDGQPVVTTVGDLTARHVGKRVRLDEHYDAKLETIFAHEDGDVSLNFAHSEGFAFGCSRTLDTPCEVLP